MQKYWARIIICVSLTYSGLLDRVFMYCTHFVSLSSSTVYSSFIQTRTRFLSEENHGKREREAKDRADPESLKNQTKHNHPPFPQPARPHLKLFICWTKRPIWSQRRYSFHCPKVCPSLRPASIYSESYLASALFWFLAYMFYGCQSQIKAILGCLLNVTQATRAWPVPALVPGCSAPPPQGSRARWHRWGSARPRRLCQHRALNSAEFANVLQYLSASADGMALQPLGRMPGWGRREQSHGCLRVPVTPARPCRERSLRALRSLTARALCDGNPAPGAGLRAGGVQMPPHYSSVNIKHHCLTNEEKPLPAE